MMLNMHIYVNAIQSGLKVYLTCVAVYILNFMCYVTGIGSLSLVTVVAIGNCLDERYK